ncbi:MAG: tRNA pseudouridine(55) synthase TruB [Clostridiales bacterium]|nr:tRNA pseudouridine(55) synthase TruB [Clostridiales bacterium]
MNGIVIVDKPQGWTSQDVTARLRRVFETRRIGHGGTLDPMATGVLPVFVGRATRGVEFFEHAEKTYEALLLPGVVTDTEDVTGTVLERHPAALTEAAVEAVLPRFRGEILQVPPMYSALKVNGQKLCNLARKGQTVERKPRPVTIHELAFLGFQDDCLRLRVRCSKGTYIRTLCKDLGEALGCGGCMAQLRRVSAGSYTIGQAVPLETLLESADPGQYLLPVDSLFASLPALTLTPNQETRCRNGNPFTRNVPDGRYRCYGKSGEFLMLGSVRDDVMSTVKSFFEV